MVLQTCCLWRGSTGSLMDPFARRSIPAGMGELIGSDGLVVAGMSPRNNKSPRRANYKKRVSGFPDTLKNICGLVNDYIMPPIPPPIPPAGIGGSSSGSSTITHSVVRNIPAIEAAFSSAILVTFVGSITPELKRFSNFSV